MVYLFIGAGQAGSAIVDDVFDHAGIRVEAAPLALNSTVRDLENLSNIDDEQWIGVSETDGLVPGTEAGFEERVTGGFGREPRRSDEVLEEHRDELPAMLAERYGEEGNVPFAFVCLGLGGGTGCGIAPHVVEAVRAYARNDVKVIAIAVLPNTDGPVETDADDEHVSAQRLASNTVFGLDRLEDAVDGIILVDNQRLSHEDAAESRFSEYNEYVASAIVDLVSGPMIERIDPGEYDDIDAPIVDIQDIVTSLSFADDEGDGDEDGNGNASRPGYASIGRSVMMTKSLPGYFLPFVGDRAVDTRELATIARAKQSVDDLSLPDAKKGLCHVRAPHDYIANTDRSISISEIRRQLESHCSEVNLGMTLTKRNLVSCTTLYTFEREDLARLREIESIVDTTASTSASATTTTSVSD